MYRFIPYAEFSAAMNMAIDEAIMTGIQKSTSPPTIRLYGWTPAAVSIGRFQGFDHEVDEAACMAAGVDIVRRITGGGAVYHDTVGEVTYSLIAPEGEFPKDIIASYEQICQPLITALSTVGIDATFSPINDIIADGRKISGNAQTRRKGVLLQHGTLLYTVDVDKMFSLLRVGKVKVSDKLIASVKKRVTSVKQHSGVNRDALIEHLQDAFLDQFSCEMSDYSAQELESAQRLAVEKYGSDSWVKER